MKRERKSRAEALRAMLASKRHQLWDEISRNLNNGLRNDRSLEVDQVIETGDQAVVALSKGVEIEVLEIKNRTLRAIEGALERLERGRYGLCEECGDEIEAARLDAVPFALYCLSCQKQLEREEKGRKILQRQVLMGGEGVLESRAEED